VTWPYPDHLQVQMTVVDHSSLFSVVVYAYEQVVLKGADRAILHRAVLSLDYKPDPDEVNRLRALQRGLREVDLDEDLSPEIERLEELIRSENGTDRNAAALSALSLEETRDAGVRWSLVGKRGAPISISPELLGLLERLYPDALTEEGYPSFLEGMEAPVDRTGRLVFGDAHGGPTRIYRPPDAVVRACEALSSADRPTLDGAIDEVVGEGPDAEETATWLERDFESLTARYLAAAAQGFGLRCVFG